MSRVPNHYSNLLVTHFQKDYDNCVIITKDTEPSVIISDNILNITENLDFNCTRFFIDDDYEDIIGTINTTYTKVVIFTLVGDETPQLMEELYELTIEHEVVMLDIIDNTILDSTNKKIFQNNYFVSGYTNLFNGGTNEFMKSLITNRVGNPEYLLHEVAYNIYSSLLCLYVGIVDDDINSDSIRNTLYKNNIPVILGSTTVEGNNMIGTKIFLIKFNENNKFEIALKPYITRLSTQYSYFLNDKLLKNDFSVNDELIELEPLRFVIVIGEDYDIYLFLNEFVEYINSNGGYKGDWIKQEIMYCEDNLEEAFENYTVFIMNCDKEVIEPYNEIIEKENKIVISIYQEEGNTCDKTMYFYFILVFMQIHLQLVV